MIPPAPNNTTLVLRRVFTATQLRVFRAWIEPEALETWLRPISAGTFLFLPCNIPHHLEASTSGPFRYLTWTIPAGFAQDVTKMGNPNTALLLSPPLAPDRAKVQGLADLLRASTALTSLEDLHVSGR